MPNIPANATELADTFPILPAELLARDNWLLRLLEVFRSGTQLVILEGPPGVGKTTLAAQFAQQTNSISVFLRADSVWCYEPDIIQRDMCRQLAWHSGRDFGEDAEVSDCAYKMLVMSLHKRARHVPHYFVVDGLDDIPAHNEHVRRTLTDMLPFGLPGYKFLITCATEHPTNLHVQDPKSLMLVGFSHEETIRYLRDIVPDESAARELATLTQGLPGHLASVRRILASGIGPRELIERAPEKLPQLFEYEWRGVTDDGTQQLALALLVEDASFGDPAILSKLLGTTPAEVEALLSGLSFLRRSASGSFAFVSESFRTSASAKLARHHRRAQGVVIDYLLRDQHGAEAISALPRYLKGAGKTEELLAYLSAEYFAAALERHQSLAPLRETAQLGLQAAEELRKDGELLRFAAHRSALDELDGADVWCAEVEARVALDDTSGAIACAQSSGLAENRLQLLIAVANSLRRKGRSQSPELLDEIRRLSADISAECLGERSFDVAGDLLPILPDLAIRLLDQARDRFDSHHNDLALANLAMRVVNSEPDTEPSESSANTKDIQSRISDPKVRRFSEAVALLARDYQADALIRHISGLEDIRVQLEFVREWAKFHGGREDAADVVEFGLKLAVQAIDYTANAAEIADIASPLPLIADRQRVSDLIRLLDGLDESLLRYGPTQHVIRVKLSCLEALLRDGLTKSTVNRAVDLYGFISEIVDVPVRAECLADLVVFLGRAQGASGLEEAEGLLSIAEADLLASVNRIATHGADQLAILRGVISALAPTRPELARDICGKLNTQSRRDAALTSAIDASVRSLGPLAGLPSAEEFLQHISSPSARDRAVTIVFRALARDPADTDAFVGVVSQLARHVERVQGSGTRCTICCQALQSLAGATKAETGATRARFVTILKSSLDGVDLAWQKIRIAFDAAESLARSGCRNEAQEFVEIAQATKSETPIQTAQTAWIVVASLRLMISAFGGLLKGRFDGVSDIRRIAELIDLVPSFGERAFLWADVAARYFPHNIEAGRSVVEERVRPLLASLEFRDKEYRNEIYCLVAPVLFEANQMRVLEELASLDPDDRDAAGNEILRWILFRNPLPEPLERPATYGGLCSDYNSLVNACDLLGRMSSDALIAEIVKILAYTVEGEQCAFRLSREQRAAIATKLSKLAETKFPASGHIEHEGYAVLVEAHACRVRDSKGPQWESVVTRARAIPNQADKAFVLGGVAALLTSRDRQLRAELVNEARIVARGLPAVHDRVSRLSVIAEAVWTSDPSLGNELLREAYSESMGSKDRTVENARRRIVDLAYRLDPDLARALVARTEDDPARVRQQTLQQYLKLLEQRRQLQSRQCCDEICNCEELPVIAWRSLASLNGATSRIPNDVEALRPLVHAASRLPMSKAYPVLAYAIASMSAKYADTGTAAQMLRPVFEGMLRMCQVTFRLAARAAGIANAEADVGESAPDDSSVFGIIGPGQRDVAVERIRRWVESEVSDYLKVSDPYLGLDAIELLVWVSKYKPDVQVSILTSEERLAGMNGDIESQFRMRWKLMAADVEPPCTEFVIILVKGAEFPIHDRWFITQGSGLRLGTSLSSVGRTRFSEMSAVSAEEAAAQAGVVEKFLRQTRLHDGRRLQYRAFTL